MNEKIKGHLAMLGANSMWGLMAPTAKLVLAAGLVTPLLLTDFRIIGAALLFWVTSAFTPRERVAPFDLLLLAGAAMLGILFNQGCYIFGVGLTSPGEASIITTTMPLWVMVLAALILGEPITLKKAGGVALGAAGALLLVLSGKSTSQTGGKSGARRHSCAHRAAQLRTISHFLPQFHQKVFGGDTDEMDVYLCRDSCRTVLCKGMGTRAVGRYNVF